MLCCDLVVAARSAKLGDAHANYGLLPGGGSSGEAARKIGPTRGEVSALYRRVRAGRTGCRRRLVNQVVDDARADTPATEALVRLARKQSPLVLRRMKALVDDGLEQRLLGRMRQEIARKRGPRPQPRSEEGLAASRRSAKPALLRQIDPAGGKE